MHARDLGAHVSTIAQVRNGTLAQRCEEATEVARRVKFMNAPRSKKRVVINGKSMSKATYGTEITGAPAKQFATLASAVTDVFMPPHTSRRSQDLFWAVAMEGLRHPMTWVHLRRLERLRVEVEKADQRKAQVIEEIHREYVRRRGADETRPRQGPMALLWLSVEQLGAELGEDWVLRRDGQQDIRLLEAPKPQNPKTP